MSTMTFINLPVQDLAKATTFFTELGFAFGLSAESRAQVDELVGKALAAGAQDLGEAQDDGFMYMRGFRDVDGHQWSFIHMDMSAIA
jgi:predicted lactoylglutathione lyase